jgi:hypothetical protein
MWHHCKGDTWQVHTTRGKGLTWQVQLVADWEYIHADKWMNRALTRGSIVIIWYSATWSSHGMPRGTHLLVNVIAKILDSTRFDRATSDRVNDLAGSGWPTCPPFGSYTMVAALLFEFE